MTETPEGSGTVRESCKEYPNFIREVECLNKHFVEDVNVECFKLPGEGTYVALPPAQEEQEEDSNIRKMDEEDYLCDYCDAPVARKQKKCSECGEKLDWV